MQAMAQLRGACSSALQRSVRERAASRRLVLVMKSTDPEVRGNPDPLPNVLLKNDGARLVLSVAGWDLAVSRKDLPDANTDPVPRSGDRHFLSLEAGVVAVPAIPSDAAWVYADALVEPGAHTSKSQEYFISGGQLAGILDVSKTPEGWVAHLRDSHVPSVLRYGSPVPEGRSGLPSSLEKVVPDELRYWEADDPVEKRDELLRTGLFTDESLRIVSGCIRATTVKRYLYEKGDPLPRRPTTLAGQIAALLPKGKDYQHPLLAEDWRAAIAASADTDDVLLVASSPTSALCPYEVAAALDPFEKAGWFVEWDDTPEARKAFSKIGQPFKIQGSASLFCASFSIDHADVEWIDKARVEKPFAGYADFAECINDQVSRGRKVEQARRICGALERDHAEKEGPLINHDIPILKSDEERYVFGIVLEPNDGGGGVPLDPDAQKDIYSAKTVRDAAHRFMEMHQNIGLQHQEFANGAVRILESYVAPVDFDVDGTKVRKGTWLLAIRVVDDGLWKRIKDGEFTGFSIGGSAVRTAARATSG